MKRLLLLALFVSISSIADLRSDLFLVAQTQAQEKEPIAYIGHGGFFDHDGKQIELTVEFVAKAQDWYRAKLLSNLSASNKEAFGRLEEKLNTAFKVEGQSRLVVRQRMLEWLIGHSEEAKLDHRTVGKLRALEYALAWKLPERPGVKNFKYGEKFIIDPEIENKLKTPEFAPGRIQLFSTTLNLGQAYIDECRDAGVPIPPPVGQMDALGTPGWVSRGFIPQLEQFIIHTPAEVLTFQDGTGMCIALPRYVDDSRDAVKANGVICLGRATSKVCFWDNQMNDRSFEFPAGTLIPIGLGNTEINSAGRYLAGGFELERGSGGICTDCHAGQNPFIIHPNADLGAGLRMGDLNRELDLPTFSDSRYDPLVPASWPQNQLSHSPALVPGVCSGCHRARGRGGAFPHLSTELERSPGFEGYCNTILLNAILNTMPPDDPGSQSSNSDVLEFQRWCRKAVSEGPTNRGDPHLTTVNGVKYDFQAAGEFTSLRNSATGFELQTRQTPVSTTFTPPANTYTGLASCVSLNTAVALRIGHHRITYQPRGDRFTSLRQLQLRIDGSIRSVPARGIELDDGTRITKADSGGALNIAGSDGTHLIIVPNFWEAQGYWYLNVDIVKTAAVEGTMGFIPVDNWLPLAPNGMSFGLAPSSLERRHNLLNVRFADAWRVTRTTSLFDYAPGTTTDNFTDRNWPARPGQPCRAPGGIGRTRKPIKPNVAARLCRDIRDEAVFQDCVFDVTVTGDAGMARAYLRSLRLRQNATSGVP